MSLDETSERLAEFGENRPGTQEEKHRNHVTALCNGKVFAYTRTEGLVLKLPRARIDELEAAGEASRLVMGKKRMTEWAVFAGLRGELLEESIRFVSGG